jgi:hypothetical protein
VKTKVFVTLIIFLLLIWGNKSLCFSLNEINNIESQDNFDADSIYKRVSFGALKINPLQALFSEFPVSFEYYFQQEKSMQFQLGFIFPIPKETPWSKLFEEMGKNGDATSDGLFSYRTSPYNNYGFSFKFELRKYGKKLYYGSQFMYKYCYYNHNTFPVYGGGVTLNQTESKSSNIFGFGFVIGNQYEKGDYTFDWYGGIGFRNRSMSITILEIENPAYKTYTVFPNTKKDYSSVYPFINFGLRIGIKLWKNIQL